MPFLGKKPTEVASPVDINSGSIDGTTIGGGSAAPATVTTFTSTGIDDNADATAITIDSSERVGIGATSPSHKLQVNASAFDGVQFQSGGSDCGYIGVNANQLYVGAGGQLLLQTGNAGATDGSTRLRIDSDGIKFGNDTAAANALDDYEEGTWTVTLLGHGQTTPATQTYSENSGTYTKVGNLVRANFRISLSSKGNMSGNYVLVKGWPFTFGSASTPGQGSLAYFSNLGRTVSSMWVELGGGLTDAGWMVFVAGSGGSAISYLAVSELNNNTVIQGSAIYYSS